MITTILFDFYGVFQPDPYDAWLRQNQLTRTGIYQDLSLRLDSGYISQVEFISQLGSASGQRVHFLDFYKEDSLNLPLIEMVRTLKLRYKIGLLSNASPALREKLIHHNIDNLFDFITISGEIGFAKPSPAAFNAALNGLTSTPQQTLFIDDNSDYTMAASKRGIESITFKDASTLNVELQARSLL